MLDGWGDRAAVEQSDRAAVKQGRSERALFNKALAGTRRTAYLPNNDQGNVATKPHVPICDPEIVWLKKLCVAIGSFVMQQEKV